MPTYKVTLNWHGEIHEAWTTCKGTVQAIRNAQFQLANKLGINPGVVKRHTWSGDKIRVEMEETSA